MPVAADLAILGAGPAGLAAAARAAELGLQTTLVARRGAMTDAARVLTGTGRLAGPGRLEVDLVSGGRETVVAPSVIVATGLRPAFTPSLSTDGERILDWRQFDATASRAPEVLVVGAGSLGVTLASQLAAAGRQVALAEMREAVLGEIDPELAAAVAGVLRRQGVELRTATRVIDAVRDGGRVRAMLLDIARGEDEEYAVSLAVLATGRRPETRAIGLDTVNVETDRHGHLLTDANQETATPGLYAVGGAVPTLRTVTAARREACQAVDHAAGEAPPPIRYGTLVQGADSSPPAAWVGLSARQAQDRGHQVCAAAATGEAAFAKLVVDAESGALLGAQLLGDGAARVAADLARALGGELSDELCGSGAPSLSALLGEARASLGDAAP